MMLTISQWSLQKIVYPDYMLHFSKSHQGYLFQTCLREGAHKLVFSEISPQGFQANSSKRTNFSTHDDEQGQYCQDQLVIQSLWSSKHCSSAGNEYCSFQKRREEESLVPNHFSVSYSEEKKLSRFQLPSNVSSINIVILSNTLSYSW